MNSQGTKNFTIESEQSNNIQGVFENESTAQNPPLSIINNIPKSKTNYYKEDILEALKSPRSLVVAFFVLVVVVVGAALLLMLFSWIRLKTEAETALWIEICSQILNGIFTFLTLVTFHARIIPFIQAVSLFIKNDTSTTISTPTTIDSLKKYVGWFDPEQDSFSLLLWILFIMNLNTIAQGIITYLMWDFSAYDNYDIIVIRMITSKRRPNLILYGLASIAISSAILTGVLIGWIVLNRDSKEKSDDEIV